jgi:hypothetical protein
MWAAVGTVTFGCWHVLQWNPINFDNQITVRRGKCQRRFMYQGLDKIMETLQILYTFLYLYGVGPPFAFNTTAVLLGMDSDKFCTICSGILYHYSWRTSSSCFRDVGGGNLCLTLVSKLTRVVQWCSNLVIVLAREDVEVHLHTLQTMTEQLQLCEWGYCCLGKLHHCSGTTSGSWDARDYRTSPHAPWQ